MCMWTAQPATSFFSADFQEMQPKAPTMGQKTSADTDVENDATRHVERQIEIIEDEDQVGSSCSGSEVLSLTRNPDQGRRRSLDDRDSQSRRSRC